MFQILIVIALACFILAALPKLAALIGAEIRWEWAGVVFLVIAVYLA